jgi:hypothetical protein
MEYTNLGKLLKEMTAVRNQITIINSLFQVLLKQMLKKFIEPIQLIHRENLVHVNFIQVTVKMFQAENLCFQIQDAKEGKPAGLTPGLLPA